MCVNTDLIFKIFKFQKAQFTMGTLKTQKVITQKSKTIKISETLSFDGILNISQSGIKKFLK